MLYRKFKLHFSKMGNYLAPWALNRDFQERNTYKKESECAGNIDMHFVAKEGDQKKISYAFSQSML